MSDILLIKSRAEGISLPNETDEGSVDNYLFESVGRAEHH